MQSEWVKTQDSQPFDQKKSGNHLNNGKPDSTECKPPTASIYASKYLKKAYLAKPK